MPTTITAERPDTPDALALITELEATLSALYPAASRHGYSVEKLIREGVAFFVLRHDAAPAGCGGVQFYAVDTDQPYGELKRMFIRPAFRGQGLSKLLLAHLAAYTRQHGITRLRLETGIHQTAAIRLYEGFGFQPIPPFGAYQPDPNSVFFEVLLKP